MSTEDLSHLTQSGQQGFGLNTTNDSRVVIFGGGIPIKRDGVVIGAVALRERLWGRHGNQQPRSILAMGRQMSSKN
jgi:hypothetical protein